MITNENNEKPNPVAKLREKFNQKKKNRLPSKELKEVFQKKEEPDTCVDTDLNKKVAKDNQSKDAEF